MNVQFVLGRAGTGKTTYCMNEIVKELKERPMGAPILFIVPDQMTFQMEYELTNRLPHGMIRAQVYSFKRLSWRILQETGGLNVPHLSPLGVKMLLRKIVEKHQSDLLVYGQVTDQLGFYDQLSEMVIEFKRYCLEKESLLKTMERLKQKEEAKYRTMVEKLHDLQLIYDAFQKEIENKYLDSENYLQLLANKLNQSTYLKNATIMIDGFESFTPQEMLVIRELMSHTKKVLITLTVDPLDLGEVNRLELFYKSKKTYADLLSFVDELQIEMEDPIYLKQNIRHQQNPSLSHLEKNLYQFPIEKFTENPTISVWGCVNRRTEIESIAKEIHQLIRKKRYRFRDIALLVREDEAYFELIEAIFKEYEIPVFIDQTRSMLHHPLIEFIRSSLEAVLHNYRYDSIFRAVKTDFFVPLHHFSKRKFHREKFHQLENFVLERGVYGEYWHDKKKWDVPSSQKQEEINEYRDYIMKPLRYLEKKFKKATNAVSMCEAIYDYLQKVNIVDKLNMIRKEAYNQGEIELVKEHDQVFRQLTDLFEQLILVLPEQKVTRSFFEKILEAGFESLRFALVPPAIDQVLVGNVDRSKFTDIKALFILGVNDGVLPKKIDDEGILNDEERELLSTNDVTLAPTRSEELLSESFVIYQTLTTPKEAIYFSYPLANEEGKALLPSLLISQLMDIFEELREELKVDDMEVENEEEELNGLVNERKALSILASRLSHFKKGYPISHLWFDVYNEIMERIPEQTHHVLSSLFFENVEKPLTLTTSKHLYGERLQASVTRLETFGKCSFRQFANYGLRLRERKVYKLESMDIGSLFHDSLKDILEIWKEEKVDFQTLTEKQCMEYANEMVEKNAAMLQHQILFSTNRYKYIKRKLKQIVGRATNVVREQGMQTGFIPYEFELPFGPDERIPEFSFTLQNGVVVELVGRIDRVDVAKSADDYYLRIIDYKSGDRKFDLVEVYYGLALQMLVYLDVVVTYSERLIGHQALPAGWFYFRLHNPMIKQVPPIDEKKLEKELLKQFKLKGMILQDEKIIQLMDQQINPGYDSLIVPVGMKKDGELTKRSATLPFNDYKTLQKYTQHTVRKYAEEITGGNITINPYRMKENTACTFCPFRSVCQFDSSIEKNKYRTLKPIQSSEQVLEQMKEKVGEENSDE